MDANDEIEQLRRQLDQALRDGVTREAELRRYQQQLEAANAKLQELATTDPRIGSKVAKSVFECSTRD